MKMVSCAPQSTTVLPLEIPASSVAQSTNSGLSHFQVEPEQHLAQVRHVADEPLQRERAAA